ncbi:glycosyltransferase family 2 protein [Mesorhizobium sp. M0833]|uniref:glycosyltransferase family 2 protein n=1 Tax=Mesorhizobium sp. M0833 TaxID=2957009 RepID=UPI0033379CBC
MPILSVIVPAYNEERNIEEAIDDVLQHVASTVPDLEIIIVDDGSRDKTAALAKALAVRDPRIVLIQQSNQGHGPALANGLAKATGDWLFLLDSDRQVPLDDFARHWQLTASHDVVLGFRRPRRDPPHRLLISAAMRLLLRLQLGVWVRDAGAPYKLIRADVWHTARQSMRPGCWIPSVLIAAAALQRPDLNTVELPVDHRPRRHGPSTLNLGRLAKFCREGVADVVDFRNHSKQQHDRR